MSRAGAHGPARAGFSGALALLVAVVTLLCVLGQVDRGDPTTRSAGAGPTLSATADASTASTTDASTASTADDPSAASEASTGSTAPCGKKAIGDHSAQRGEGGPQAAGCSGHAATQAAAGTLHAQHSGTLSSVPAPPPPTPLHSVLRI